MGIILSVVIPFGPSLQDMKLFHISILSPFVLFEFGVTIVGSLLILMLNQFYLIKRVNKSSLLALRETVLE